MRRMKPNGVTEERVTFLLQQAPCVQFCHDRYYFRALSKVHSFCGGSLCAGLNQGARQPPGALPRVIISLEPFFLSATGHPSKSIRNSMAGPVLCLISWETFLLFELPI